MELVVTAVDNAPPELNEQVPFNIKVLRMLPGRDRPDYWLGELAKPLFWLKANHRIQIDHVVVCARWQGMQIEPRVQHLPIGIAYVTDPSQVAGDTLDFDKCQYVAIGLAHETSEQPAPTFPTPIQAGTIGRAFGAGQSSSYWLPSISEIRTFRTPAIPESSPLCAAKRTQAISNRLPVRVSQIRQAPLEL